ncbi:MAG: DUF3224 domain-containing protein [Thermoanaerobaculia bacterium]
MNHARGEFEVKVTPQPLNGPVEETSLGRLLIEKQFRGDFVGTGQGQMLSAMGTIEGSGAYVAAERVNGKLDGREGSFALIHRGTMRGGNAAMEVTIVPDSGTAGFSGISGALHITIDGKVHHYDLEYSLPPAR